MFVLGLESKKLVNIRWDASSCQHFGLHGVEALALTDAQLDLYSVMGVVLEEEAVVDDKLSVGSRAIEDVDLQGEEISSVNSVIITCLDGSLLIHNILTLSATNLSLILFLAFFACITPQCNRKLGALSLLLCCDWLGPPVFLLNFRQSR